MGRSIKTINKLVTNYRKDVLVPRFGEGNVTEDLCAGLEAVLRGTSVIVKPDYKQSLLSHQVYGDIHFSPRYFWLEREEKPMFKGRTGISICRILRFFLDNEGLYFSKVEIREHLGLNAPPQISISDTIHILEASRFYVPERIGRVPMRYGARPIKKYQENK